MGWISPVITRLKDRDRTEWRDWVFFFFLPQHIHSFLFFLLRRDKKKKENHALTPNAHSFVSLSAHLLLYRSNKERERLAITNEYLPSVFVRERKKRERERKKKAKSFLGILPPSRVYVIILCCGVLFPQLLFLRLARRKE
jgi:hypothetical protein